jgi:hypothetical protein
METDILEQIKNDASQVIKEVIEKAKLKKVSCSSSDVLQVKQ